MSATLAIPGILSAVLLGLFLLYIGARLVSFGWHKSKKEVQTRDAWNGVERRSRRMQEQKESSNGG